MDHYEMVEKLRERANVSYEEARAALEASNWDLLDAMVYLESNGRMRDEAPQTHDDEPHRTHNERRREQVNSVPNRVLSALGVLIGKGNENFLVMYRKDKEIIRLPLTALVILILAVSLWWLIPITAVLLIMGYGFTFKGPNTKGINNVVDKATNAIHGLGQDENADKDSSDHE